MRPKKKYPHHRSRRAMTRKDMQRRSRVNWKRYLGRHSRWSAEAWRANHPREMAMILGANSIYGKLVSALNDAHDAFYAGTAEGMMRGKSRYISGVDYVMTDQEVEEKFDEMDKILQEGQPNPGISPCAGPDCFMCKTGTHT